MALHLEIKDNKILLYGETFSVKEQIKLLGGRWNAQEKHWWLLHSESNLDSLKTLGFQPHSDSLTLPTISILSESTSELTLPTAMSTEKIFFKISEFVQIINSVIKTNLNKEYWIYGEISSFKTANGHVFFDLIEKDESLINSNSSLKAASISCILWAGKRKFLQHKIEEIPFADGTQIKIKVGIDFRKEGARIIAIVEDIDAEHTKGNLLLQRLAKKFKKSIVDFCC